jgi:hypothetical protein
MSSLSHPLEVLANLLPDEPQWIDLKGLLIRTQTLEGVVGQASEWR